VTISRRIFRLAVSLGGIAAIGAACVSVPHIHVATAVLALLLAVLIIANQWGFVEAFVATGLGALILDYFLLPPRGWGIQSFEHWLVFITFVAVALLTSYQAARGKRLTEEIAAQHRELERLYAFGRDLPIKGSPASVVAASLDSLVRIFQIKAAAFYDSDAGNVAYAGTKGGSVSAELLRRAIDQGGISIDKDTSSLLVPIRCGAHPVGSLVVYGDMSAVTLRAMVDRTEAHLEKVYAQEAQKHAEEAGKRQELKTALLDSLVHEIKTPLSVIKTAASSLLSKDTDTASRRELLSIIDQEADRMDASISEAFWTARVEAGTLESGKGPHDLRPLVDETLHELKTLLENRTVVLEVPDSLPPANCDSHMIKGVLKELLTNALKYSASHSPLTISMRQAGDEIITSIADSGIGVEPGEEKLIFQRHYRGRVRARGTGVGLAIAKTIVEAHGGRIGVESKRGTGSVFNFSLPVSHRNVA